MQSRGTWGGTRRRRGPAVLLLYMASCLAWIAFLPGCEASTPGDEAAARRDAGVADAAASPHPNATDEATPADPADYAWPEGPRPTVTISVAGQGDIVIELYPELAPKTVANFIKLASEGFYDDTTFHRVLPGYMIQGGDPNTRDDLPINDGQGGPGYRIDDEINGAPHLPGVVSMANTGRENTGGSQFFILTGDAPGLDALHTIFGRVVAGQPVVEAISEVETDRYGRWGPKDRPIEDVVLERVMVHEPEAQMAAD